MRTELARAEKLGRQQRQTALQQLATQLTRDATGAADQAKVQTLAAAVKDLASASASFNSLAEFAKISSHSRVLER